MRAPRRLYTNLNKDGLWRARCTARTPAPCYATRSNLSFRHGDASDSIPMGASIKCRACTSLAVFLQVVTNPSGRALLVSVGVGCSELDRPNGLPARRPALVRAVWKELRNRAIPVAADPGSSHLTGRLWRPDGGGAADPSRPACWARIDPATPPAVLAWPARRPQPWIKCLLASPNAASLRRTWQPFPSPDRSPITRQRRAGAVPFMDGVGFRAGRSESRSR
jgi:hypothetical protein